MKSITPIDGRYSKDTKVLQNYMSEYALMHKRYKVECDYLTFMCHILKLPTVEFDNFNDESFREIKKIESITNHDVKAVEMYVRNKMPIYIASNIKELIHFGLTSHDINSLSYAINIKTCNENIIIPLLEQLVHVLETFYDAWKYVPLLSHTHGQPAVPSTLGKEIRVFSYRLSKQLSSLCTHKTTCKFGGAIGNLNGHKLVWPDIDWPNEISKFLSIYGICREKYTTQLSNYDNLSEMLSILQRINTILIDLCQDLWLYISMEYFHLKIIEGEVGSSTMPHKVNPIHFENAEGNLGLANSLIQFMETKLPTSRLQRDLTDSTVMRNIGTIYGYQLKAYTSISKGLRRLEINRDKIKQDLQNNYVVIAEAIQLLLRVHGYNNAYEKVKNFTRSHTQITKKLMHDFINELEINDELKNKLQELDPFSYIGYV